MSNAAIIPNQIPAVDSKGNIINKLPKHKPIFFINFTFLKRTKLLTIVATPSAKMINKPILVVISMAEIIVPSNNTMSIFLIFFIFSPPYRY